MFFFKHISFINCRCGCGAVSGLVGKGGGVGESGKNNSLQAMDNLESSRIYFQWTRADLATKLELLILVLDFSNQS